MLNSLILVGFGVRFRLVYKGYVMWTLVRDFWSVVDHFDPLLCNYLELVKSVCNLHCL